MSKEPIVFVSAFVEPETEILLSWNPSDENDGKEVGSVPVLTLKGESHVSLHLGTWAGGTPLERDQAVLDVVDHLAQQLYAIARVIADRTPRVERTALEKLRERYQALGAE